MKTANNLNLEIFLKISHTVCCFTQIIVIFSCIIHDSQIHFRLLHSYSFSCVLGRKCNVKRLCLSAHTIHICNYQWDVKIWEMGSTLKAIKEIYFWFVSFKYKTHSSWNSTDFLKNGSLGILYIVSRVISVSSTTLIWNIFSMPNTKPNTRT